MSENNSNCLSFCIAEVAVVLASASQSVRWGVHHPRRNAPAMTFVSSWWRPGRVLRVPEQPRELWKNKGRWGLISHPGMQGK